MERGLGLLHFLEIVMPPLMYMAKKRNRAPVDLDNWVFRVAPASDPNAGMNTFSSIGSSGDSASCYLHYTGSIFVVRVCYINYSGTVVWQKEVRAPSGWTGVSSNQQTERVFVSSDAVYLASIMRHSSGYFYPVLTKIDKAGTVQWQTYLTDVSLQNMRISGFYVDASGIYLASAYGKSNYACVIKLNPDATSVLWYKQLASHLPYSDVVIAPASDGGVYAAYCHNYSGSTYTPILMKFSSAGVISWFKYLAWLNAFPDSVLEHNGNVYLSAGPYIFKYTTSGAFVSGTSTNIRSIRMRGYASNQIVVFGSAVGGYSLVWGIIDTSLTSSYKAMSLNNLNSTETDTSYGRGDIQVASTSSIRCAGIISYGARLAPSFDFALSGTGFSSRTLVGIANLSYSSYSLSFSNAPYSVGDFSPTTTTLNIGLVRMTPSVVAATDATAYSTF